MALKDPFAAYDAADNVEAQLVCGLLTDAGIEAAVVEDMSQAGLWVGGTIAGIHKPQVWIERHEAQRAQPVIATYERRLAERRAAERTAGVVGLPIDVTCEKCGRRSTFPAAQLGTIQNCPHCLAYVDVGEEVGFEGWENDEPEG